MVRVSADGLATARAIGSATVVASAGDLGGGASVRVEQRPAALHAEADSLTLALGTEVDLAASVLDGGGTRVGGASVTWVSRDSTVVSVSTAGHARARAQGETWAIATAGALTDSIALSVGREILSIRLDPTSVRLTAVGESVTFRAVGVDALGQDVGTLSAMWSAANPQIAASGGGGTFTAVGAGTTSVTAAYGSLQESASIEVAPEAASISIELERDTLRWIGASTNATVTALDRSGNPVTTPEFQLYTSNSGVTSLTVNSQAVKAAGPGEAWIIVRAGSLADSAVMVVVQDPVSIDLVGDGHTMNVGDTIRLTAVVADRGAHAIAGTEPNWSSSKADSVSVDEGLVTALGRGTAWVTASFDAFRDSVPISVTSTHTGDLVIASQADLDAFKAAGWEAVNGNVTIQNTPLTNLDGLESLQRVTGRLTVSENGSLTDIAGLGNLHLATSLVIEDNPGLDVIALPALDSVPGLTSLVTYPTGGSVSLPALSISGSMALNITDASPLLFPALTTVTGHLSLFTTAPEISLPVLRCVRGTFSPGGPGLQRVSAPALDTIGDCPGNVNFYIPSDGLSIRYAPDLTFLDLSGLESARYVTVENASLDQLVLPNLRMAVSVKVEDTPVTVIELPSLRGDVTVSIVGTSVERVEVGPEVTRLFIVDNPATRELYVDMEAGTLELKENPRLELLEIGSLTSAKLTIEDNDALAEIRLASLTSLGYLRLVRSPSLRSLTAPALISAGTLGIADAPLLDRLEVPALVSIGGPLTIARTGLTDLTGLNALGDGLGADPIVVGAVNITGNAALPDAAIQAWIDLLEAKYGGSAFPSGITVSGNGG